MPPTPSLRHPRRLRLHSVDEAPPRRRPPHRAHRGSRPLRGGDLGRMRQPQAGYLPDGPPKRATVVTTAAQSLTWQLRDASGTVVASGATLPRGADTPSGQSVQVADFSSYRGTGSGYVLAVDGSVSVPFDIRAETLAGLRVLGLLHRRHRLVLHQRGGGRLERLAGLPPPLRRLRRQAPSGPPPANHPPVPAR
ncbi:cellulase N-terminal Ig-like domain-containing protein [Streptomyces sp. NPDC050147]|uniref:cellulase N-terminal Ig-like domain-containing protein n=1 Tax=Streptomyces sp. NPDC050147 TaxID=3155513 RepID=UPI00341FE57A